MSSPEHLADAPEPVRARNWILLVPAVLGVALAGGLVYENTRPRIPGGLETAAQGSLEGLYDAQQLFREADKEGDGNLDYGALNELANSGTTGLIDSVLGSGTKRYWLFECTYSATTSEFLWFATARPIEPGLHGDRYFAINHEGTIYYTTSEPFRLNATDCTIPSGAIPVGR